ncbi:MAG: histidinol-phosphatase, partial [Gammaproteobacteria bacterium]|nr:histidinol-phosphatase [Gammaproteobacteria bacterium]
DVRHKINIPDVLGYKTLKCDFHMHTVFSDGAVWPTVRVDEAWRHGLDAISITDHIEYQPHKKDVPTNHKRPYEIALGRAKEKNILLVKGAEITRDTPPGHFNALFLEDINLLDTEDFIDAVRAANNQGGFVFWNHPGWKPEAKGWFDIHTTLYENTWLDGIEVVNGDSYYPEAHQWALEKNLTMMGNSDIHQPIVGSEITAENHRPMTLVFAKEKSIQALREALVAGRTAVWFKNQLIGRPKYLHAIFRRAVQIDKPYRTRGDTIWFEVTNNSDIDIQVQSLGQGGLGKLTLPANAITMVKTKVNSKAERAKLRCQITNFLVAPDKGLPVNLNVSLK